MGIKAAIKRISDLNQLLLEEVTGNEVMPLNVSGDRSISINVMQAYIFGNLSQTATVVTEQSTAALASKEAAETAAQTAQSASTNASNSAQSASSSSTVATEKADEAVQSAALASEKAQELVNKFIVVEDTDYDPANYIPGTIYLVVAAI